MRILSAKYVVVAAVCRPAMVVEVDFVEAGKGVGTRLLGSKAAILRIP
jgi:hypothetical protein